jgi:phospholipid transport system transporter-binding protein
MLVPVSLDVVSEPNIERVGGFHFQVHGAMTFEHAKALLQQSEKLFANLPEVEIDLRQVEKADSSGLALMFEWMAWAEERKAKLSFIEVPEAIHAIANLCQTESLLSGYIVPTSSSSDSPEQA